MQLKPIIAIHQPPIGQRKSTKTSYDGNTSLDNNMKHRAPCSSRGYNGLRESGPLNIDGDGDGDVGEDDGGVGVGRGDDDGPRRHSGATKSKGERAPLLLILLP